MTSLQYYCILGLAASQRQNYAQKMQDAPVTKSLNMPLFSGLYTVEPTQK